MKYMLFYFCVGMLAASCAGRASRSVASAADATQPVSADTVVFMPPLVDTVRRAYTEQELAALQDSIHLRLQRLKGTSIAENVWGSSVLPGTLEVNLRINSPEQQAEFRRRVADVPVLSFSGSAVPPLCPVMGANDTLGLYLRPEYTVYSTRVPEVSFVLYNCSGKFVDYGEDCFVAYRDTLQQWRKLPTAMTHNDLAHRLSDNRSDMFRVPLYPLLNRNRPGTYRFFKEVEISRQKLLLMTEFRLTDNEQEYLNTSLAMPPPLVEQYKMNAGEDVMDFAEVMPSFPEGEEALRDYVQNSIPPGIKETKRAIVMFVVEQDGTLTHIEVVRSAGEQLDKEAVRIVEQMPRWIPGRHGGRPVRVKFTIPITFRSEKDILKAKDVTRIDSYHTDGQTTLFLSVVNRRLTADWISERLQKVKYYRDGRWVDISHQVSPGRGRDLAEYKVLLQPGDSVLLPAPFYNRREGGTREMDGDYCISVRLGTFYCSAVFRIENGVLWQRGRRVPKAKRPKQDAPGNR